jgi:alpha-beta hydrolase superfamily lysophospholipase
VEHPVIRRTESHFTGARGHSLLRRTWAPTEPERVLVLVHGYAEHSGRYDHVGAWFASRGCAVSGYDHQGHGLSTGPRCHVRRFPDFVDDLEIAVRLARDENPGLPLFVVGHSMGGLITASYLVERHPAITGAVLSGPALALGDEAPRLRLAAARLMSAIAPRLSVASGLDSNGISRDPEVVRAYLADPLIELTMTVRLGAEMLASIERTASQASKVEVPLLLLHGEEDPLCPAQGSRDFHAGLTASATGSATGSAIEVFPKLRHEIFNEPEQETVFARLLEWVAGIADPEPRGGART